MAKKKQIKPVGTAPSAKLIADQAVALAEFAAKALVAAEQLQIKTKPVEGLSLSADERASLAVLPTVSTKVRKKLAKADGEFTIAEVGVMVMAGAEAFVEAELSEKINLLGIAKKLMKCLEVNIVMSELPGEWKKPVDLLYQLKITLRESQPPIWRRIQVKDCTLDKLHEHIQTAMGWTNSHLHHFEVGKQLYGNPMLIGDNFEDMDYENSTATNLSDIIPENRDFSLNATRSRGKFAGLDHDPLGWCVTSLIHRNSTLTPTIQG